jgi:Tol biopolymer transport system component
VSIRPAFRLPTLVLAVVTVATACGGGGSGGNGTSPLPSSAPNARTPGAVATKPASGKPSGGAGSLIISMPAGLVEYSIKSGKAKPLVTPSADNTFLLDPAISPDGQRLAYIVQPPPKVDAGKYDAGSDLWVVNRDGTAGHAVFTHVQPNQLVRFPQWQDDQTILVIVQESETKNGVAAVSYVLERIDAAGGARTNVLSDVLSFGLSPDRKRLAYARLAPQTGETLNAIDIDGTNDVTLVGIDQQLSPFNVPRYSPDGTKIAFASADQTGARGPSTEYVSAVAFGPPPDGLPEDIWTVDAGGGRPVRIADLKEDLPSLAWGGDGTHIYVLGAAGLYDVNVGTGAVDRLGDGAFHGQVAWAP